MRILWCFADRSTMELNTSLFRIVGPMRLMSSAGHESRLCFVGSLFTPLSPLDRFNVSGWSNRLFSKYGVVVEHGRAVYDAMRWADIVVIERLVVSELHTTIKWLRSLGKRVFATFDDAYHLMPIGGDGGVDFSLSWRGGKSHFNGRGAFLPDFRRGLALCDGAMVPSLVLKADYDKFNPNISYVPNFVDETIVPERPLSRQDNIIIGWGGSLHHHISWKESGIIPALAYVCEKNKRVVVHVQGPHGDILSAFRKVGIRYVSAPPQPIEDWYKTVSGFTIGVAPLAGEYDRRRSSLKVQEYGMMGIPWVATDYEPYRDVAGGIKVNNRPKDWIAAIMSLVGSESERERLAAEGRAWATALNRRGVEIYERVLG